MPENTTIEKLSKVFTNCGQIIHISLPKFVDSKKTKGFAFIEFEVIYLFNVIGSQNLQFIYSVKECQNLS